MGIVSMRLLLSSFCPKIPTSFVHWTSSSCYVSYYSMHHSLVPRKAAFGKNHCTTQVLIKFLGDISGGVCVSSHQFSNCPTVFNYYRMKVICSKYVNTIQRYKNWETEYSSSLQKHHPSASFNMLTVTKLGHILLSCT